MKKVAQKRPTIGVLAGGHVYYGTILGNFIGPLLHGVCAAANDRRSTTALSASQSTGPIRLQSAGRPRPLRNGGRRRV